MKSAIEFNNYLIHEISFKRNHIPEPEEKLSLDMNFEVQVSFDEKDSKNIRSDLTVNISGFIDAEASISGFFRSNYDISDFNGNDLHVITASILIPYIRSMISFISSADGNAPIIIPTINLNALFQANSSEEE